MPKQDEGSTWSRSRALAVGQRVKAARRAAGLSQAELAEHLKQRGLSISPASICNLERGLTATATYTRLPLLYMIAAITGIDAQALVSEVGAIASRP